MSIQKIITPPRTKDDLEKFYLRVCDLLNTLNAFDLTVPLLDGTRTYTGPITGAKFRITAEGGYAVKLTNKTGAASVKGSVVTTGGTIDNSFILQSSEFEAAGIVYETGVADGAECWVVITGIAEVLLKDGTAATRGNWTKCADTDGRAEVTTAPSGIGALATSEHFREIGHCLESKDAGTNVLAKLVLHFN